MHRPAMVYLWVRGSPAAPKRVSPVKTVLPLNLVSPKDGILMASTFPSADSTISLITVVGSCLPLALSRRINIVSGSSSPVKAKFEFYPACIASTPKGPLREISPAAILIRCQLVSYADYSFRRRGNEQFPSRQRQLQGQYFR